MPMEGAIRRWPGLSLRQSKAVSLSGSFNKVARSVVTGMLNVNYPG